MAASETKKALIVVRTYPTPARNGVEVSCTAAITESGEWLRLFPVRWRFLPSDRQFRKYQWVNISVQRTTKDRRPESYRLADPAGIKILSPPLGTANGWRERKRVVFPLRAHCLCCLVSARDSQGSPTLGIFRPLNIDSLAVSAESASWTDKQLIILRQQNLFENMPRQELEKIPFSFRYCFRCDEEKCPGHKLICTDWEMGESYRKWKRQYGDGWEQKFRQRYESDMIRKYDTHFYVGTVHQHPQTWIICGLFYPPRATSEEPTLFQFEPA